MTASDPAREEETKRTITWEMMGSREEGWRKVSGWQERRSRNSQGKDPRTFEENSQGGDPSTPEENSQVKDPRTFDGNSQGKGQKPFKKEAIKKKGGDFRRGRKKESGRKGRRKKRIVGKVHGRNGGVRLE